MDGKIESKKNITTIGTGNKEKHDVRLNKIDWGLISRSILIYILAVIMIVPFLWVISTSFKIPGKVFEFPIKWIPDPLVFDGYIYVWKRSTIGIPFYIYYINSIKISAIVLVGTFFSCSLAAYGYTKINFKGRDFIFLTKLATMMIPIQVTMLPVFIIYRKLGLIDTHAALWVGSFLGATFGTFLLRQFFMGIPNELCESARMDGAGHLKIYWNIILPLAKPALASMLIFTFVGTWNNYEAPLLYLRTAKLYTIPIGLKMMSDEVETIHYPGIMAGVVSSMIPIFLIFSLGQKYFVEGINFSGIKG